ncbi:MAG: UbiD family decarboxylase [Acidimicrobiales bacterium]
MPSPSSTCASPRCRSPRRRCGERSGTRQGATHKEDLAIAFKDIRSFLDYLGERGELAVVDQSVDVEFEIAAYIRKASDHDGPAFLFNDVKGFAHRVVGGVFCTPSKAVNALGAEDHTDAQRRFADGLKRPLEPVIVDTGPCRDIVMTGDDIDLTSLPIPRYSEQDPGRFVTVGVEIVKDFESGTRNAGIYRMQLFGPTEMTLAASPYSDWHAIFAKTERAGRPLEMAVAIGVDPLIQLATQVRVPLGVDELALAGGLHGAPVEVVRCETIDLEVPATAEIVLEGVFDTGERRDEGPFGEMTGYVGPGGPEPVFRCTAVTMRTDAVYQAGLTGVPVTENHVLKLLPMEVNLRTGLDQIYPDITGVHYAPEGGAEFLAIVGLRQRYVNQAKNVLLSALGSVAHPKMVIVVDDDIDIYNPTEVWWAVLTRAQPADDVIIIPRAAGGQLDPSAPSKFGSSLMGIDATRPFGEPFPEVVRIPGVENVPDWSEWIRTSRPPFG